MDMAGGDKRKWTATRRRLAPSLGPIVAPQMFPNGNSEMIRASGSSVQAY
jgi:hypothetical protein